MWLCKLIGHTHVENHFGWSQFVPGHCTRCFAAAVTPEGDGAITCKIFGHRADHTMVGDYDCQTLRLNCCQRCHAKA
jgi:hypothetical protein